MTVSDKGTGQGSVISPLLANVYLHYTFDLWAERWRRREATGDMIIVRYADDLVVGFEHESDARRFWDAIRERLQEFSLSLHPDKTRLIEFGRHAATKAKAARAWQTGDLQLLGLYSDLRQVTPRILHDPSEDPTRSHEGETQGDQRRIATAYAQADPRTGEVAQAGHHGLLCLPCSADKLSSSAEVPRPYQGPLAANATPTQSEGSNELGADYETC